MDAQVGYDIGLFNNSVTFEDFAHVEMIVFIVVARQRRNTTDV